MPKASPTSPSKVKCKPEEVLVRNWAKRKNSFCFITPCMMAATEEYTTIIMPLQSYNGGKVYNENSVIIILVNVWRWALNKTWDQRTFAFWNNFEFEPISKACSSIYFKSSLIIIFYSVEKLHVQFHALQLTKGYHILILNCLRSPYLISYVMHFH